MLCAAKLSPPVAILRRSSIWRVGSALLLSPWFLFDTGTLRSYVSQIRCLFAAGFSVLEKTRLDGQRLKLCTGRRTNRNVHKLTDGENLTIVVP
jgi:hypothetical protein